MRYPNLLLTFVLVALGAPAVRAQTPITVTSAQPEREIASLAEANEIRIRFSEPMVPLGRIPEPVTAPFFSVRPAIRGSFRWAGPTILVFTPDPRTPLPFATRFDVTIAATATAHSGRTLGRPYTFSFTTPTARLLQTNWYRSGGRYDQKVVVTLRFNQPVRPADVLTHTSARYEPHSWDAPDLSDAERQRMGPAETAKFDAKVAATLATAGSRAPIALALATNWDRQRFPPSPDLVVLETVSAPAVNAWMRLAIDNRVPAIQGSSTPASEQSHVIQLEDALFVDAFGCRRQCDADGYNFVRLRTPVRLDALKRLTTVRDVSSGGTGAAVRPATAPRATYRSRQESVEIFAPEDLGYDRQTPDRTWAYTIDRALTALDGQVLGYTWVGIVENWHDRAFVSFGDGHGVWEKDGGPLPFSGRNFVTARQWLQPLTPGQLMPTILDLRARDFRTAPQGIGSARTLAVTPDRIQSYGLNLTAALGSSGTGLVWAAIEPGQTIPRARSYSDGDAGRISTVVQVTNLGITVKDSPQNTLVFVTRLDTGVPVGGADVSIVRLDNTVAWIGRTNADGVTLGPGLPLRDPRRQWEDFKFIVTAVKDGDVAYVGSDWNEGIEPYAFGHRYDLQEAQPLLRGTVFSDRGVYKLGEEVHVKAILRRDTPAGIQLIAPGTPLHVLLKDGRDKVVDRRTVTMNAWSAAEWVARLPGDSSLGNYELIVSLDKDALEPAAPKPEEQDESDWQSPYRKVVRGGFLVAAYRRPEFRVDANLAGDSSLAGAPLKGVVTARYLFGAPMQKRPVAWTYSRTPVFAAPAAVLNKYPASRFIFVGDRGPFQFSNGQLESKSATLDAQGQLQLDLETPASDGYPFQYTLEGTVEDVSRQVIAGRASAVVHPAPWYIGLQRPSLFVSQRDGLNTTVVAVAPDGIPVPDVRVELSLVEVQYHSVRRAEGNGFYTWDTQRTETEVGRFMITSAVEPVPLAVPLANGGSYMLRATAADGAYKSITQLSFYAIGAGYTAWERYDHNRIDLVPEQQTYKPGDTARLMIKSPWERATALMTVEREGIRSHSTFQLTSTQETVMVPISAADIPNIFVSVLLVKGRTAADVADDTSDPGKPSFRIGYARLNVEDASKRLSLAVKANKDEFRPAGSARVDVLVKDAQGGGASSEVTLWAVDYGVLSLTGFKTPDVLKSVYVEKALQVMNTDSRQRIVSRRVLTPKGETDGGGGGADSGVSELRKDFRVLAFWLGSVTTDAKGHASADIKLPESLTTYRIMAVAADKASRFGSGESEIRINKPVVLKAAFPRFMTRGDKAYFGSVVTSQLKQAGPAIITMRSLDPGVLQVSGESRRVVQIGAGGSAEVRFDVVATGIGRARVQTTVRLGSEGDAFEESIPVEVMVSPETVAVYGEAAPDGKQPFEMPKGIVPGVGGLRVEVSSTALVGLHEGARYVVEYPYGCAEQRASRAFVMAVASDLGDAFKIQGIDAKDLRARTQKELKGLEAYQCSSGGFAYWPGACMTVSPYLTSYVVDVYQTSAALNYQVDRAVMERAYDYLQRELAEEQPVNEGWWPAYTAWESFAVKVLVKGGRRQDSNITRLYGYLDRMPVFALSYLLDAMTTKGETGARPAELRRRIDNAISLEAGTSHVEELADPYLLYFWNSNVRSTALVLSTKVRTSASSTDVVGMVRWLVGARKNGRWDNTQENAIAMKALVDYYRKYESVTPDFTATVALGAKELIRESFKGRTTTSVTKDVPMAQLSQIEANTIAVHREGAGTAFYNARLTYAPDAATLTSRDNGFHIERRYAVMRNGQDGAPVESFAAGDLVRVTLVLDLPKERRYVAVTDPIPAGFEPVESWFTTTAADLVKSNDLQDGTNQSSWDQIWRRGTFDHVERHDDRVELFATRLSEGHHEFSYVVRATTAGAFIVAPSRAEEMYSPEVSGRTRTQTIEITR